MALQTTAVARQWPTSDYVGIPTDTKTIMAQKQSNDVLCAVRAEML
jgi:hypothetical protein